MNWASVSEIVVGQLIEGYLTPGAVVPEMFLPPYSEIVATIKSGQRKVPQLIDRHGSAHIDAALSAVASLNGHSKDNWVEVLKKVQRYAEAADRFHKYERRLRQGEAIDQAEAISVVRGLENLEASVVTADKIKADRQHVQKSGYQPYDHELGGIPQSGVFTYAAMPKSGKSTKGMKLAACKARLKEHVFVISTEMPGPEWKARLMQVEPKLRNADLKYIHVYQGDEDLRLPMALAMMGQVHADYKTTLTIVDMPEMLLDKVDEPSMTYAWKELSGFGRRTRQCVYVTAHFNDNAYHGGIPHSYHIRYGRMTISYSVLLMCGYNPNIVWSTKRDDAKLPAFPGEAYDIAWICRFGFGRHGDQSGAIRIKWNGATGWGEKSLDYHELREIQE